MQTNSWQKEKNSVIHLPVLTKDEQKYVVDILDSYEDIAGQIAVESDKLISTRRFTGT